MACEGALNFVVDVNGSGKSSILRTLYRIFLALSRREHPALPISLAWDRQVGRETRTALLHISNDRSRRSFFATLAQVPPDAKRPDWEALTQALGDEQAHPLAQDLDIAHGEDAVQIPLSAGLLPKRIIAYSSGAEDAWLALDQPEHHPRGDETGSLPAESERPPGWTLEREWEREQALGQSADSLETLRHQLATNRMRDTDRADASHLRIRTPDLRLAGITLALWQSARELDGKADERELEALRQRFLRERAEHHAPEDARRVLNEIDWFRPTHLSLVYRDDEDRATPEQRRELFCLLALADTVVAQPNGRMRAVISLGPADEIMLSQRIDDVAPLGISNSGIGRIAKRVDFSKTGAAAVLRIFSADESIDSTPMDCFTRLRDWQRKGLLDEITLTIQRLHRPEAADGEDEIERTYKSTGAVVTYDQLSDGEQMLLGRMGLIFLLRGQDGSLLLLDEPETHFNDVWKREVVDMLDRGLLNSTGPMCWSPPTPASRSPTPSPPR